MHNFNKNYQKGQALVTLLVFIVVGITIVTSAIEIIFVNSLAASKMENGINNYYLAESGIENGILRLLRNPDYTGETLSLAEGNVGIQVVHGNPIIMTSQAVENNILRKIQAEIVYNNGMLIISSWKEIY
ncbi:MAG: hypothetical protein ABH816_00345 [Candidatus Levyibacteriota bacterium]